MTVKTNKTLIVIIAFGSTVNMNVLITTFHSPFSFFCVPEEDGKDLEEPLMATTFSNSNKIKVSDVNHGQYIAVLWKNKWVRGVISTEHNHFLIWLVDYGIYLKHDDRTVYINLPPTYKRMPTKVFEASIHGVAPLDRILSDTCEIKNVISTEWTNGAIEKAQSLITNALHIYFVPIALISTEHNDVVVGDVYLELKKNKLVNIINELEMWPAFLEKNETAYVENLKTFYVSRRKHRACTSKPAFLGSDFPIMNYDTTLKEYSAISASTIETDSDEECSDVSEDGSTVLELATTPKTPKHEKYTLRQEDIEKYSHKYLTIRGVKYNALEMLINKINDLNMCEKYKDHDMKSVGRATQRCPKQRRSQTN